MATGRTSCVALVESIPEFTPVIEDGIDRRLCQRTCIVSLYEIPPLESPAPPPEHHQPCTFFLVEPVSVCHLWGYIRLLQSHQKTSRGDRTLVVYVCGLEGEERGRHDCPPRGLSVADHHV